MTVVLKANVLVEKSCQIFPVDTFSSTSIKPSVSTAMFLPFLRASLVRTLYASFFLPLLSNQRGDSGMKLKKGPKGYCRVCLYKSTLSLNFVKFHLVYMSSQDIKTLLGGLLFLLYIWFDSLPPSQHFSTMSGQVFICSTSTKQRIKCRAQGHNAVPPVRHDPATP